MIGSGGGFDGEGKKEFCRLAHRWINRFIIMRLVHKGRLRLSVGFVGKSLRYD